MYKFMVANVQYRMFQVASFLYLEMKGDLILHLDPQPLPTFSDHSQDEELELSQEPDSVCEVPSPLGDEVKDVGPDGKRNF